MSLKKELRNKLGFTQQQMADYLSVSESLLSMAEINHRQLPIEAHRKLDNLYDAIEAVESNNASENNLPQTVPESQFDAKKIKNYLDDVKQAEQKLLRKLDALVEDYNCYKTSMQATQILLDKFPAVDDSVQKAVVTFVNRKTKEKVSKCDELEQAMLKSKIHGLKCEVEMFLQLVGNAGE